MSYLPLSQVTKLAGENPIYNHVSVAEEYLRFNFSATTGGQSVHVQGRRYLGYVDILKAGAAASTVTIFDNYYQPTGFSYVIDAGIMGPHKFNVWFVNGIYIVIASGGNAPNVAMGVK